VAMVYLLHAYFGRDGREEAEELLARHSGDADKPRILTTFNEPISDWLSFFCFTYFTDRDGKYQLKSLAESAFDPLSRTCRFMLTEEAHHMFVGETGVTRVVQRTCEAMKEAGISDPYEIEKIRKLGVIDLPTIQKKANLHFSLTLDLFGNEISTNAANSFHAGLKGRFREDRLKDDHQLESGTYPVLRFIDGEIKKDDAPALSALNMRLRDDYVADCQVGVDRWNKVIAEIGIPFEIKLPHVAFHRHIGEFASIKTDVNGNLLSDAEWGKRRTEFLPSDGDREFIEGLMQPQFEVGKFASWIAPPRVGIDNKPGEFEYVKIVDA